MKSPTESEILIPQIKCDFADSLPIPTFAQVIEFYEEAGLDYGHWSKNFNMHFGFYRRGTNPFDREKMLEQMNLEIADRLRIDSTQTAFLIDLGCGMGAIARTIAKKFTNAIIKGVTLSPSQVEFATKINTQENLQSQIEIFEGDYTKLPFANGIANGVWAVESACHGQGSNKGNLVKEMARVLKTGGRFAIADCFLKQADSELNFLIKRSYRSVCQSWILPEMPVLEHFVAALKNEGFQDLEIEDISWRVAPSLAHAPFAVSGFIFKKLVAGEKLNHHSLNNLKASLLAISLGLNRSKFSYCLISGKRG